MVESITAVSSLAYFGRACRGEHYSGDLAYRREQSSGTFLAVVDAAGHGPAAHDVATKIETIFELENTIDLVALTHSLHDQLKGGLGAVMIAGFLDRYSLEFKFIHIGDTHGKVFGSSRRTLISQAGMLGHAIRSPIIRSETLAPGDTLVLCTDGVSERYDIADIPGYRTIPADSLARQIVEQFGKNHDDATCFVVRLG